MAAASTSSVQNCQSDFVLNLIRCIEKYPEIYNIHANSDHISKDIAWLRVKEDMAFEGKVDELKSEWDILFWNYSIMGRSNFAKCGAARGYSPEQTLIYKEALRFLDEYPPLTSKT